MLYGYSSGFNNKFAGGNAFFGHRSGYNNLGGTQNSFFGYQAGSGNNAGRLNDFFGSNAGVKNKGSKNTFMGAQADQLNNSDSLEMAIALGYNAKAACSRCAIIGGTGDESVKTGIGVNAPDATLHIHEANNTRLKISNDNSKEIYIDLIRNDDAKLDYDWRLSNNIDGDFEIKYHKTDLEGNPPTTVLQVDASHLNLGSSSIDLGQSNIQWKTVYAKSAKFSQLVQLQPLSSEPGCASASEGAVFYHKTSHTLKVCSFNGVDYKWVNLH